MNPLQPSVTTLVKLGCLIVHYQEARDQGHEFDHIAVQQLEQDKEVVAWIAAMQKLALLPVKR